MKKLNVCLMNDSFPPTVDGVATCVLNYAAVIERELGHAMVCTPYYPNVIDDYPYPVIRYPSLSMGKVLNYRAGLPFDTTTLDHLREQPIDIIHAHCPITSTMLARTLRESIQKPIVLTYHTKFNYEIEKMFTSKPMQKAAIKMLITNISACDEVWVVSNGAGENLRSLGYQGDYIVMDNGVDFPKGRADEDKILLIRRSYSLSPNDVIFLFVGRMMWYKGIRLMLDGLKIAKAKGQKFKMLFVGDGAEKEEIIQYAETSGLKNDCIFVPAIHDRELLRAFYSCANLFLFPSDFDTNGLVVREAAACGTASVVLRGSCACEGITDHQNGILIDKDPALLAQCVIEVCANPEISRQIGENAMSEIYLSWEDSVKRAYDRYQVVLENYARVPHASRNLHKGDDFFRFMSYVCTRKKHPKGLKKRLYRPTKHKVFKAKKKNG